MIDARTVKISVDRDIFPFIKKSPNRRSKNGLAKKRICKEKENSVIARGANGKPCRLLSLLRRCLIALVYDRIMAERNEIVGTKVKSKTVYVEINTFNYTIYYNIIYKELKLAVAGGSKEQLENFTRVSWPT